MCDLFLGLLGMHVSIISVLCLRVLRYAGVSHLGVLGFDFHFLFFFWNVFHSLTFLGVCFIPRGMYMCVTCALNDNNG